MRQRRRRDKSRNMYRGPMGGDWLWEWGWVGQGRVTGENVG